MPEETERLPEAGNITILLWKLRGTRQATGIGKHIFDDVVSRINGLFGS